MKWKKLLNWKLYASGRKLHTWILGLPREAQNRGYFAKVDRRPSAIIIKPIKIKGEYYVIIHGFITKDWTTIELKHKDHGWRSVKDINVIDVNGRIIGNGNDVSKVFNVAFEFIRKYLRNKLTYGEIAK